MFLSRDGDALKVITNLGLTVSYSRDYSILLMLKILGFGKGKKNVEQQHFCPMR